MKQKTKEDLIALAEALRTVRGQLHATYVLFVGGKASTIEDHLVADELRQLVLREKSGMGLTDEQVSSMSVVEQMSRFDQKWSEWGSALKIKTLRALHDKLIPTKGHWALALLLKENYFPLVLTTAIDQLIESVFIGSTVTEGLALPQWSVLVNGRDPQEKIYDAIRSITSDTTILKLCGDIPSRTYAVTQSDIEINAQLIGKVMEDALRMRDLIMVGLTPLDDLMLQYFPSIEGSVHFIGTERLPSHSYFEKRHWNQRPNYILDEDLSFELVFQTIAEQLNLFREVEQTTGKTLSKVDLDRLRQVTQVHQTTEEALVEFMKGEQQRGGLDQTLLAASGQINIGEFEKSTNKAFNIEDTKSLKQTIQVDQIEEESLVELVQPEQGSENLISLVDPTIFTIHLQADRRANFTVVGGGFNYTSANSKELEVDIDDLNELMQDMGQNIATYHRLNNQEGQANRGTWRRRAKLEGKRLYTDFIQAYPELDRMLAIARKTVEADPKNLTLVFNGPRNYLGMPYELLQNSNAPLVTSHPLCRTVSGVNTRHGQHFDAFARMLQQKQQPLKVLLIASGTPGISSDEEIIELQKLIDRKTQLLGLKADISVLPTNKATLSEVRKQLSRCIYHIVHYAGHGEFDKATGENSGLLLWQRENQAGERVILTARELAGLLAASETRLFYLNACVGAWTGSEQLLRSNDYLGMMDAIVQAGVPYVLGFRWSVIDSSSRKFASLFYDRLFIRPLVPERAVLHARAQIYAARGTDETWTSPILVAQTPYR